MASITVSLRITSTVEKVDGSKRSGPSTTIKATATELDAWEGVQKIMMQTINRLHTRSFGGSVRHGLLKLSREIYSESPFPDADLSITYHVHLHGEGRDDEGEYHVIDERADWTRPI